MGHIDWSRIQGPEDPSEDREWLSQSVKSAVLVLRNQVCTESVTPAIMLKAWNRAQYHEHAIHYIWGTNAIG